MHSLMSTASKSCRLVLHLPRNLRQSQPGQLDVSNCLLGSPTDLALRELAQPPLTVVQVARAIEIDCHKRLSGAIVRFALEGP